MHDMRRRVLLCLLGVLFMGIAATAQAADTVRVYIGTYTGKTDADSKGIYLSELDLDSGKLSEPKLAFETPNPTFLAAHPSKDVIYAAGEIGNFNGEKAGGVSAYAFDKKTGALTLLNAQSSKGGGPCHVSTDPDGKFAFAANYGGGSVVAYKIEADGKLAPANGFVQHVGSSVNPSRQKEPHAHSINTDRKGKRVFACDLGMDMVLIYKLDGDKLVSNEPSAASTPPGGGPRHLSFTPNNKFAYVCNELTSSVTAFSHNEDTGELKQLQTITTLPQETKGNSTAEIVVHPSGKFVYCSNRGHDSLAIYKIDEKTGLLTNVGYTPTGGKTPRNFNIDPSGKYLVTANQTTGDLFVFKINKDTGELTPTGSSIKVAKAGRVLFVK
jgi:6-phosphogluconolactonase